MDIGSSILHHTERHINACLTCLVMRHGTYGFHVTTKDTLGVAGYSEDILQYLLTRLRPYASDVISGTDCKAVDENVLDLGTESVDFTQLPRWLLMVVTEQELTSPEVISSLCRWCRRLKTWNCHHHVVVLASTTPPPLSGSSPHSSPVCIRNKIQKVCLANPELRELRIANRLRLFEIPHWQCVDKVEPGFVEAVRRWLNTPYSGEDENQWNGDQHMTYTDITKMVWRDIRQSLPHIEIFLRLSLMCVLGLLSVCLTLAAIVAISKEAGLETDVQTAQYYLAGQLSNRRTGKGEWGRAYTPLVITALQLYSHHWCFDSVQNQRSVDRMELGVLASLAKLSMLKSTSTKDLTPQHLATDINALLATYLNPRDFYDHDLVDILAHYINDVIPFTRYTASSYSDYIIALCNSGYKLGSVHAERILEKQSKDGGFFLGVNEAATALLALSCIEVTEEQIPNIKAILTYIRDRRKIDGSYGSIYTTSLVLQAYNITGQPIDSRAKKDVTLQWLTRNYYGNSALKDLAVTSSVLVALSGRSVLDIPNVIGLDKTRGSVQTSAKPWTATLQKYWLLKPDPTPGLELVTPTDMVKHLAQNMARDRTRVTEIPEKSTKENLTKSEVDDAGNETEASDEHQSTPTGSGHRWKIWKRKIFDEDATATDDNQSIHQVATRRRVIPRTDCLKNSTYNENCMEYVLLLKCEF